MAFWLWLWTWLWTWTLYLNFVLELCTWTLTLDLALNFDFGLELCTWTLTLNFVIWFCFFTCGTPYGHHRDNWMTLLVHEKLFFCLGFWLFIFDFYVFGHRFILLQHLLQYNIIILFQFFVGSYEHRSTYLPSPIL